MKIIHAADIHFRREHQEEALASLTVLAETAEREKPALVALAGDLFDAGVQNSAAAGFPRLLTVIQRILDVCPIAAVSGTPTHDLPGCYEVFEGLGENDFVMLKPSEPLFLYEGGVISAEGSDSPLDGSRPALLILGCPEPGKEWFLAGSNGLSAEEANQKVIEGMRGILLGLGAIRAQHPEIPCVMLYHGAVTGATMANGQLVEGGISIGREDLALVGADYYALGHIHLAQQIGDLPAYYPGSAYPVNWGEVDQKGFNLVEIDPSIIDAEYREAPDNEFADHSGDRWVERTTVTPFPHPPRAKFVLDWPEPLTGEDVDGKQCWIVYRAKEETAGEIAPDALLDWYLTAGALPGSRVTIEQIPTETVRAAEITQTRALVEKVQIWEEASDGTFLDDPIGGTLGHLKNIIAKCGDLEREASASGAVTEGLHIRLRKLRLRGAIGIWKGQHVDEIELDLDRFDAGLVALVGVNGAGKTTLIENMHPYRSMLTREGKLQDHFRLRDSARELTFVDERTGAEYRSLMLIDGVNATGKAEYHLFKNGEPITDGRAESYDSAIASLFGSLPLFLRSAFVSQRATKSNPDLTEATKGEKKAIFRELAGLDYLQAYAENAKAKAVALEDQAKADRVRANLIESMVTAEPDVRSAILLESKSVDDAGFKIAEIEVRGSALREKVEMLHALVTEQEQIGRDIGVAANEAQKKLAEVERAHVSIRSYQEAVSRRDQAQAEVDEHAKLKEREGAENARLSGINKERSRLSAEWADAVAAHRKNAERLQAAKTKIETSQARLYGDRKVLQTKIDHAAAEVAFDLTENCPTCGQKLPEAKLEELKKARTAKIVIIDDWKHHGAKMDREIADLSKQIKDVEAERAKLEEPERPKLQEADETELHLTRAKLLEIDVDAARAILATAAKAEQEIATLQAQVVTLQTDAEALVKKAHALRSSLDPAIKPAHEEAQREYEEARTAYTETKAQRAAAEARLQAAQKKLEEICGYKTQLEDLKKELATIESDASEWRYLERACGADGIQALELDAMGPGIASVANRLLSAAYGERFQIEFRTTRIAGKGSKTKQVEDFSIWILDSQDGSEQELSTLSGGEAVWIKRALYEAFGIIRDRNTGTRFLTVFQDEADGALDPESRQRYFAMLQAAHQESGRRHTIIITHSQEAQEMIAQRIVMSKLAKKEAVAA